MLYEFPIIAFTAAATLLLPLPWHWRVRNVATMSIIFWLFVENIIFGIDAIVWGRTVDVKIPLWCDITTKLLIGGQYALPSACLCICMHLEQVASVRSAHSTMADKRKRTIFELIMCVALPAVFMALHYIVQGHRFDIVEEYGCRPSTYYSIAAIFIVYLPPIVLSLACLVYAGLALRHFMIRRISFASHLASKSALTTSRYMRLILMSVTQMVWTISITGFTLAYTASSVPLRPWTNWADVHSDFLRVDQFSLHLFPKRIQVSYYFLWWTIPASTFIFVAFFAFGKEAVEQYKAAFSFCYKLVSRRDGQDMRSGKVALRSSKQGLKPLQLPLHALNMYSQDSSDSRLKRSNSMTSSTVVASPTTSKNYKTDTWTSMDSYEEVSFAVYSPTSSPTAFRYPVSPSVVAPQYQEEGHSVYTVPSLSAFPHPPQAQQEPQPVRPWVQHDLMEPPTPAYARHSTGF